MNFGRLLADQVMRAALVQKYSMFDHFFECFENSAKVHEF